MVGSYEIRANNLLGSYPFITNFQENLVVWVWYLVGSIYLGEPTRIAREVSPDFTLLFPISNGGGSKSISEAAIFFLNKQSDFLIRGLVSDKP